MLFDNKKDHLPRILIGALLGIAAYLLLSWLTQPGSLFGGHLRLDFTFCFSSLVPEPLGAALGFLLWALFGAETAIATLPFAGEGRTLLLRTLTHFAAMALTLMAWVLLNFPQEPLPSLLLSFLLPFALVYLLVWLGRWVGWYAEVAQFREKLGLTPAPSPLKWKETLPLLGFVALLFLLLPLILRLCDPPDVPVLSGLFYPWLLLPIAGFCSAVSLGKRQGFCPLYPAACALFTLLFLLLAKLFSNMADGTLVWLALLSTLPGNALGAAYRAGKRGKQDAHP